MNTCSFTGYGSKTHPDRPRFLFTVIAVHHVVYADRFFLENPLEGLLLSKKQIHIDLTNFFFQQFVGTVIILGGIKGTITTT